MALHQLMVEEELVLSAGWEMRMKLVIHKLNEIVSSWTKSLKSKSGHDALCFDPFFTTMVEDIFVDLDEMLERRMGDEKEACQVEAQIDCFIKD
ncbi:nuclear poly(A) polymerase 3 [Senna tora]|uniref:Nuclear poly(A) polymerase 3 n=1 Tax=Senna tora TaxID=362788 RepID=A0A834TGE2_9FABA|nr:nuclear poly(A) polymerase 3 [Senna tora]